MAKHFQLGYFIEIHISDIIAQNLEEKLTHQTIANRIISHMTIAHRKIARGKIPRRQFLVGLLLVAFGQLNANIIPSQRQFKGNCSSDDYWLDNCSSYNSLPYNSSPDNCCLEIPRLCRDRCAIVQRAIITIAIVTRLIVLSFSWPVSHLPIFRFLITLFFWYCGLDEPSSVLNSQQNFL